MMNLETNGETAYDEEKSNPERGNEQELGAMSTGNEVETPKVGMSFQSEAEIRKYYNSFAILRGFGIAKTSTKKGDDGKQKYFSFACAQNGKTVSVTKESFHPRPSTKTNCKAKINVAIRDDGRFIITRVYLDHNHKLLSPEKARRLRCNKVLESHGKKKLKPNDLTSMPLNKISHSPVVETSGYENLPFGEDCSISNARELRLGDGDAEALCIYFHRMQSRNSNFFYMIDVDDECRIRNVFWADARCRSAYESFGDVVLFDTTYLTKSYDMPLVPLVGVNHHGHYILFGCGLLSSKNTNTFVWLFKALSTCMLGRSPKAVITNQCKDMQAAILEVFPDSRYGLCLWQIMKKVPVKLGGLAQYKTIKKILKNLVYNSVKADEFEKSWMDMIGEYNLEDNEWLQSLYEDRQWWGPVYVNNSFWAGMSTIQRSESMNSFFDNYVHSKTTLKQFVEQYDNALKSKVQGEKNADSASCYSVIPTITSLCIERQFQNAYTNDIFKQFQEELRGLTYCNASFITIVGSVSTYEVTESLLGKDGVFLKEVAYQVFYNNITFEVQCLCHLFEFKGILCRHAISVLIKEKVNEVPSHYVLERWQKDVKRGYISVENVYDDFGDSEQTRRRIKLSSLVLEVLLLGQKSDDKCNLLTKLLEQAREKLLAVDSNSVSQPK